MDARLAGDTDDWLESDISVEPFQPSCKSYVSMEPFQPSCTAPESSFEAALASLASLHRAEVQRLEASAAALLGKLAELREDTACGKEANSTSHVSKEGNGTSKQALLTHLGAEGIHKAVCQAPPVPPTQDSLLSFGPHTKGPHRSDIARQLEPKGSALDPDSPSSVDVKEFLEGNHSEEEKVSDAEGKHEEINGISGDWRARHSDYFAPGGQGGLFADPELPPRVGMILDTVSASVVLFNALTIGVSSDLCEECLAWEILEFLFLSFYVSEALFKIIMLDCRTYVCGKDKYWNWFDILCIMSSFADIAISYIVLPMMASGQALDMGALMMIKLFRMLRIFRIIRTLRFEIFKELKMMILGVYSGLRSLFWAIVLLIAIAFVLGVAARMFYSEHPEFSSVDAAMFTLFRCFTDGCAAYDGTPLPERLKGDSSVVIIVLYILITMIVTVGLFNLIMATFIDNVNSAHDEKRQLELGNTADDVLLQLKHALCELEEDGICANLTQLSKDAQARKSSKVVKLEDKAKAEQFDERFQRLAAGHFCVTRHKWKEWLARADFLSLLKEADISASNKMELFDALDADGGGELNIEELLYGLMKLRGPVSKSEIVAIRVKISYMCQLLQEHLLGSAPKEV